MANADAIAKQKQAAAEAALAEVQGGDVVGVGSGSTVDFFIDALAKVKNKIDGAVAASEASAARLHAHGVRVLQLNQSGRLPLYVDGADEATRHLHLIKGGGGALTREKIIAEASETFVCIADSSKLVKMLGRFALPVEVIPMAQSSVARQLAALGARPQLREDFTTDNGNLILDLHGLQIDKPMALEARINQIAGVVAVGIFARRGADKLLLANDDAVETFT